MPCLLPGWAGSAVPGDAGPAVGMNCRREQQVVPRMPLLWSWVLATDPVKGRSKASLRPSCASPCPVCRGGGQGVVGWLPVVLLYYFRCCHFKRARRSGKGSLPHNC